MLGIEMLLVVVKVFCNSLDMHSGWAFSPWCLSHHCLNVQCRQILGKQATHGESARHAASQGDRQGWALNLKNFNSDRQSNWGIFLPINIPQNSENLFLKKPTLSNYFTLCWPLIKKHYSFAATSNYLHYQLMVWFIKYHKKRHVMDMQLQCTDLSIYIFNLLWHTTMSDISSSCFVFRQMKKKLCCIAILYIFVLLSTDTFTGWQPLI